MNRRELINSLQKEYDLKRSNAMLFAEQNKQRALLSKEYLALEIKERTLTLDIAKAKFKKEDSNKLETEYKKVKINKLGFYS